MKILAIETSCDETSIAVLNVKEDGSFNLLSNLVSSQVKIHAPFGGVVPMLAKREHQKNLVPILIQSLAEADLLQIQNANIKNQNDKLKIQNTKYKILNTILDREPELLKKLLPFLKKYAKPDIDLIAVTNGPGLEPTLWVGVNFAKALAAIWNLPVMPVNHVEAHIAANWLEPIGGISNFQFPISKQIPNSKIQNITNHQPLITNHFPALALIVSGGHTQLVLMRDFGQYKILGETRDDAAGEAFDKLAKMLNLGYPGGPIVAKLATKFRASGSRLQVKLPRPMLTSPDYDFSFSGLKTAALYFVKTLDKKTLKKLTPAICAEFQQAAIDVLVSKTIRAAKEYNVKTIMLGGGVAANKELRSQLQSAIQKEIPNTLYSIPNTIYCGDNAAMIALTAYIKIQNEKIKMENDNAKFKNLGWDKITVDANSRIS